MRDGTLVKTEDLTHVSHSSMTGCERGGAELVGVRDLPKVSPRDEARRYAPWKGVAGVIGEIRG